MIELNEEDVEFLLNNTGFTHDQIIKWHKEFLNCCSTGFIKFEQFLSYYRILLPIDLNDSAKEQLLKKLFNLFDIDGDNRLNFSEFLVSFWIRCKAPVREKYTWIFNMLDEDRNGFLSYSELRNGINLCLNVNDLDELLEKLNQVRNNIRNSISNNQDQLLESESEEDFDLDSISTLSSKSSINFNEKKYDLFSRVVKLVDDKLHETVFLLNVLANYESNAFIFSENSKKIYDQSGSPPESPKLKNSTSIDSLNSINSDLSNKSRLKIEREQFLSLCTKYKSLRKLLLPIANFYEDNIFED